MSARAAAFVTNDVNDADHHQDHATGGSSDVMNGYGHMMNGWGYPLMAASTLAFWVLVVLVVIVTRTYLGGARHDQRSATPDQILATRFARGDIDQDEYVRGQAALTAHLRTAANDAAH